MISQLRPLLYKPTTDRSLKSKLDPAKQVSKLEAQALVKGFTRISKELCLRN